MFPPFLLKNGNLTQASSTYTDEKDKITIKEHKDTHETSPSPINLNGTEHFHVSDQHSMFQINKLSHIVERTSRAISIGMVMDIDVTEPTRINR